MKGKDYEKCEKLHEQNENRKKESWKRKRNHVKGGHWLQSKTVACQFQISNYKICCNVTLAEKINKKYFSIW